MRRIALIIVLIICTFFTKVYADELSEMQGNLWDGQKSITNSEFEKAIDVLQGKQKKKEAKQKKKRIKKLSGGGTSLHSGLDPMSEIQAQDPVKKQEEDGLLLNIPVKMYIDGNELETGFYNVTGEKNKEGEIFLSFYQAHYLKGKVKAAETQSDYDSDVIDFVKLIPYNDDYIKVVFGSLDFNAYAYIRYIEP